MNTTAPLAAPPAFSRTNPFLARMTENYALTKPGSAKDTRHLVLDLTGSGLTYKCGDSLGVFPRNPSKLVEELLSHLKLDRDTPVPGPKGTLPLHEALASIYTLNRASKKFVKGILDKLPTGSAREALASIAADDDTLDEYVYTRDYVDILSHHPGTMLSVEELLGLLNKTAPRLYSIASSLDVHPNEVHLTVAVVSYTTHDREKLGLASGHLSYHVEMHKPSLPVYVQPTRHFHLPSDPNAPLIMVGPGTGIAPFRAFLEQRKYDGAKGANWLLFGDQKQATDFLYGEELTQYQRDGLLTRLDTAFSRDQDHKIYVQNRMLENAKELWKWLQEGAYFYVCGDAKRMARDVHAALICIAQTQGGMSPEQALEYVEVTLAKTEKRYLKDVY